MSQHWACNARKLCTRVAFFRRPSPFPATIQATHPQWAFVFFHLGNFLKVLEDAVGCFGSAAAVCTLQLRLRAFNDVFLPVSVGCLCKLLDFFGSGGVTTEVCDEASDKEDEDRSNKQLSHPSSMVRAASIN